MRIAFRDDWFTVTYMISRRTIFLSLCAAAAIFFVIAFHLLGRYHLNRAHPSHPVTLNIQDGTLRQALQQSFPGKEIVFETDESKTDAITLTVMDMSSVHIIHFLEKLTNTLIYRRGERIIVTRESFWYSFFYEIDYLIFRVFGNFLWTSHGKP